MNTRAWTPRMVALFACVPGWLLAAEPSSSNGRYMDNLTLAQALETAERMHPQLAEARALSDAAAGRVQQAGAFPNPEVIAGAQQIPFAGGQNQREYIAGVAQQIPISRRLAKAREAEELDREVRLAALELTRRNLRKQVHSAFAVALYQDAAFQSQSQVADSYRTAVATTKARLEAGDALPEDLARVEMELARVRMELQRSRSMREQSLVALAAAMGDANIKLKSLAGNLEETFEIPTLELLANHLPAQPEMKLAEASFRASNARVDLAKAERIPDLRIELLYHRLEATRDNTVDVGVSIPMPLFSRNQGRLREARAEVAAAEARAGTTQNDLKARLWQAHHQLTTSLEISRIMKNEILSRAGTVLRSAEARYAAGDVSLAEILPVRRDWAAAKLDYLESLREVMQAWGALRSFSAGP